MNLLRQTMGFVTRNLSRMTAVNPVPEQLFRPEATSLTSLVMRSMSTLHQMHRSGPHHKKRPQRKVNDLSRFCYF